MLSLLGSFGVPARRFAFGLVGSVGMLGSVHIGAEAGALDKFDWFG